MTERTAYLSIETFTDTLDEAVEDATARAAAYFKVDADDLDVKLVGATTEQEVHTDAAARKTTVVLGVRSYFEVRPSGSLWGGVKP